MNVLTECLAQGTSPVGVVSFAKEYLKQQGFEELYYNKMISDVFETTLQMAFE